MNSSASRSAAESLFMALNVYRTTLLANIPAILVRLPLGDWLLDYLPSSMVYQRCYIIQMT